MSDLDRRPAARELGGLEATAAGPALQLLPRKEVLLGESTGSAGCSRRWAAG